LLIPIFIFTGSFLVYKNIYPEPRNWYDHYLHLARSLTQKRVDVPTLPSFYHDKIEFKGKTYIPFPPAPAMVLIPFMYLDRNVTQQQVSIIIGALNATLIYFLAKKYTSDLNAVLLSIFFAFGTVAFWTSVVGTTWNFAHTVANFFLLLSLICLVYFEKKYLMLVLSGILFAAAALSRMPILLSGLFFVSYLSKNKGAILAFLIGAVVFIPITFYYNFLRFGSVFDTGYTRVYQSYASSNLGYSIQKMWNPDMKSLNYFDVRAIPYHLYTMLVMPPEIKDLNIFRSKPSPFGMGIIFTSPFLLLALIPPFKKKLEKISLLGALPVALLVFSHYAQGWVQFGYRFILDFILFLMMILAIRFKATYVSMTLLLISITVNYWGVLWGIKLGW